VNGVPVRFVVDTGATDLVLSPADAERAGARYGGKLIFSGQAFTANGMVETAHVTLESRRAGQVLPTAGAGGRERGEMQRQPSGNELPAPVLRIEISRTGG
jgi:aspartyl protease family protein